MKNAPDRVHAIPYLSFSPDTIRALCMASPILRLISGPKNGSV